MTPEPSTPTRGSARRAATRLAVARHYNGVLWACALPAIMALAVVSPPTARGPAIGWSATAVHVGVAVIGVVWSRRASYRGMLVLADAGATVLAVLTWADGGMAGPYDEFYLVLLLNVSLIHRPRVVWTFTAVVCALALSPLLYEPADERAVEVAFTLVLWIQVVVVAMRLMRQLLNDRKRLVEQAERDSLTGLGNRRAFTERLWAMADEGVGGHDVMLVLVDVDRFKAINDEHGHLAGDEALIAVAMAMRTATGGDENLFRWGGDEFVVVLEGSDPAAATAAGDQIRAEVRRAIHDRAYGPVEVTVGAAAGDEVGDLDRLLDVADRRLRAAEEAVIR